MAIGRVNTGGGGSGGTLTVTGVAGHTVTATKGGKTYTRTFNSSGVAVFKGLATGTWTLTMTGDGQTATRTVDVNADYAITITYFAATIRITYPATSNCVVKNASGKTVASNSNTGSSTKTWTATVDATGTYTITATSTSDNSQSKSTSVTVADGDAGKSIPVTLSYNFVLFAAGSGLAAGYTAESKTTDAYSFTDSALVFNTKSGQGLKGLITPAIDLTDFSKMLVTYKDVAYYDVSDTGKGFVGVTDKEYSVWSQNNYNTPGFPAYIRPSAGEGTQELDISGLSGNYYFVLSGDWFAITVTSIIFE